MEFLIIIAFYLLGVILAWVSLVIWEICTLSEWQEYKVKDLFCKELVFLIAFSWIALFICPIVLTVIFLFTMWEKFHLDKVYDHVVKKWIEPQKYKVTTLIDKNITLIKARKED